MLRMQSLILAVFTPQFRKAIAPIVLFALGFFAISAPLSLALRAAEPMPDMMVLSPKLKAYQAAPDTYDTVFIGTSRTLYHIVPEEIERGAAEAGCTGWNVLNLGIFGLKGAEQDWLISQVLENGNGSIERIIIEDPLPNLRTLDDVTTNRARYFQSPDLWPAQMDNITSFPESLPKRIFRTGILTAGIGYDLSGVGRAAAMVFPSAYQPAPKTFDMSADGFEALDNLESDEITARHQEFINDPGKFHADLKRYGAPSNEDTTARAAYLAGRLDDLTRKGLEAALYISPDLAELDRTPRTGEAVRNLPGDYNVLNFNRPDVYPDLFERALWFDFSHLDEAGARRLSFKAGQELCPMTNSYKEAESYAFR